MKNGFYCDWDGPIVDTKSGKVRGFRWRNTYQFRGIPYAHAERFMMPEPVAPWSGVRDCFCYGRICVTIDNTELQHLDTTMGFRFWPASEECQFVNIWTPEINDGGKRPVMVFLHGGRFANGSSLEHEVYEAEQLCSDEDVVIVSLNHRLNIVGFLDLSAYGKKYENSGNAGMADIVAALQWVQDNISQFGGDPSNVTIFGQSGGGGKVSALMQIPAAKDLFHKAIIQSGVLSTRDFPEDHEIKQRLTAAVVAKLGLDESSIDEIQKVSYDKLTAAFLSVVPEMEAAGVVCDWAPVKNDYYLGAPNENELSEKVLNTPMIIGSNMAETLLWMDTFYDRRMSEQQKLSLIKEKYGDYADKLIHSFKMAYPDKDLLDLMHLDCYFRDPTMRYLDKLSLASNSRIYAYLFAFDFDILGGQPAWHAAEHSIVFKSYNRLPVMEQEGIPLLSNQIAGAWAAFARTGNPDNTYLCHWEPFTAEAHNTMIFDHNSSQKKDHDKELISLLKEACPFRYSPKYLAMANEMCGESI